jgi:RimJ/RimL family protein N-acetyltransferase
MKRMLIGKTVFLRILEKSDLELVRRWRNSPDNYRHFANWDFITSVQQENWFALKGSSRTDLRMIIVDKSTGRPIGITHLESIDYRNRNASWGIYIAEPEFRTRTYAVESTLLLFDYAFEYMNIHKIYGNTLSNNPRGRRFHKLVGFKEEAVFKKHVYVKNLYADLIWIALFRSDWNSKRKRLQALLKTA